MEKRKNAIMLADTRPALVGHVLLQLQNTNKDLFDEAIVYYTALSESDKTLMLSIMPCRFIKYEPPLPKDLFQKTRFQKFSVLMFVRYEMFRYLNEFKTVTWIDTDVLIQGKLDGIIESALKTGFAILREDPENKTAKEPDRMKTCFTRHIPKYNLDAYLYPSGTISISDELRADIDYSDWCYKKTVEWADIMDLPDQGVLNAMIQEFNIKAMPLKGILYACFPYYGRDCSQALCIHSWGDNKFWNDWYLYMKYPAWKTYYEQWLAIGGSSLAGGIYPEVSIVIPVFKPNSDWFRQALDSLINQKRCHWQRYSNFEIIIVAEPFDEDNIRNFIAKYDDPRIRLVFNEKRLGIAASLNKGMRLALGKYIARLDDDDIANEYRLVKQAEYLNKLENIHMCVSDFNYFGDMNQHRTIFEGEMSRAWSIFTCPFDHPTIMFRRSFFLDNDLFYDEERSHAEDWELWIRAFQKGMAVGCLHEELSYHRWHSGSAGQNNKTDEMMGELVYENFRRLGIIIPKDMLPCVGPWKGKLDDAKLETLNNIFNEALSKNAELQLYDKQCLYRAFSLRLREARTGVMPEIWYPISGRDAAPRGEDKISSKLYRRVLKCVLRPLYLPFKHRYEDRIIRTEQKTVEIQDTLASLSATLTAITEREDNLRQTLANIELRQIELSASVTKLNTNLNHLFKEMFEHVSTVNDGVREQIGNALTLLHPLFDLQRTQYAVKKKILLLGTPGHSNIGDAAIAAGEYEFIKKYFSEYVLIEIDAYHMDEQYEFLQSVVGSEDLIFLHGGGNLGDLYLVEEALRRRIVDDFPNNRIVILPQTIYFSDTDQGIHELAVSSEIYNRHRDLLLFTRGESSLAFAHKHFQNVKSFNSLDMAMLLHCEFNFDRDGILACIRDANDESGIDDEMRESIYAIVERFDSHFEKINNLYTQNISSQMRNTAIYAELKKFARHKIVVTDRLHGMLFSVITKTPCIAISAKTQKIREFCTHFKDSNAVFFIDKDIPALESAIEAALAVQMPDYPVLKRCMFDEMCKIIHSDAK